MPVCPNCGTFADDEMNFCTECGTKLIRPSTDPEKNTARPDKAAWQDRYQQYRPDYGPQYQQFKQNETDERYSVPDEDRAPADSGKAVCIVSLVFGILGFTCFFSPLFSVPGLITGIIGVSKTGRATAKFGLILSVVSLVLFTVALIVVAINGFDFSILNLNNITDMIRSLD